MSKALSAPPAPGLYRGVPPETYFAWDCASRSTLSKMADADHYTPEDVRLEMLEGIKETDALALGTVLHCAVLEPLEYDHRAGLGPVNPKTGRTYGRETKAWADQAGEHPGVALLTTDQVERVPCMVASIQAHPRAARLLELATDRELTIVRAIDSTAICDQYGLPMIGGPEDRELLVKSRLDAYCPTIEVVLDLKTTSARTDWEIRKSVTDWGYHHQLALYPEMARNVGLEVEHAVIVFTRSDPPWRTWVVRLTEQSQRIGWIELLPAMETMARCYRLDQWPGAEVGVLDLDVADWKLRQHGAY